MCSIVANIVRLILSSLINNRLGRLEAHNNNNKSNSQTRRRRTPTTTIPKRSDTKQTWSEMSFSSNSPQKTRPESMGKQEGRCTAWSNAAPKLLGKVEARRTHTRDSEPDPQFLFTFRFGCVFSTSPVFLFSSCRRAPSSVFGSASQCEWEAEKHRNGGKWFSEEHEWERKLLVGEWRAPIPVQRLRSPFCNDVRFPFGGPRPEKGNSNHPNTKKNFSPSVAAADECVEEKL